MDTVRKGIFNLDTIDAMQAVTLYLSAYIVGTVLLNSYSAFGMPVSTTATLVFCLAGGAIGVTGDLNAVNWPTFSKVVAAIIISIFLTGLGGFFIQRIFRGAVGDKSDDYKTVLLHGPWISGLILTFLTWFMVIKGLKGISAVKVLRKELFEQYGTPPVLMVYWGLLSFLIYFVLKSIPRKYSKYLFHVTAIVGMCSLAFAFGQNDLANAASPGLATFFIWKNGMMSSAMSIPQVALFGCGILIFFGMTTKKAQRVTRAEVNVASQYDSVALYAPKWCMSLARKFVKVDKNEVLAPAPSRDENQKKIHYDPLRASVIMAVSASVIASASGLGLPVSTTYVGFAAVVATGWGDKVFAGGDADIKAGRAIWVVTCWFLGAFISVVAAAIISYMIFKLSVVGIALALALNLGIKFYTTKLSDEHEIKYHKSSDK